MAEADKTWQDALDLLLREVDGDEECRRLNTELIAYAASNVEQQIEAIRSNLATKGLHKPLSLLWPGAGYNSVACGGSFEVLGLLEKAGVLKIGEVTGASGGAASAILALADADNSSRTLLRYYMVYAKWAATTWDFQILRETPLWGAIYNRVIDADEAFDRVSKRGYVSVASGLRFSTWILNDFSNRRQCTEAYVASGEASIEGLVAGWKIPGLCDIIGRCCDGGGVNVPRHCDGPVLFHNSFYGYAAKCSMQSIEFLFKKGVDETLQLLSSPELKVPKSKASGGMSIVPSAEVDSLSKEYFGIAKRPRFLDVATGEVIGPP